MSKEQPNPRNRPKKKPEASLTRSSAAEYLTFVAASGEGGVEAVYADENVWLSQKMMGLLYDVETHTINYHLKNIFSDAELQENSVIRNFRITAPLPQTGKTERLTGTWRIENAKMVLHQSGAKESDPFDLTIKNRDSISYDIYFFDRDKD